MTKVGEILSEGRRLADRCKTWADLSNALFDPLDGLVAKTYPDPEDRHAFRKTDAYVALHDLVEDKMREVGVVAGAEPKKSGRFVVRLPRSMHAALEKEATVEGTSLNQLVLAKLAVQLRSVTTGRKASIVQAFAEVRNGLSADRVIADPALDRRFLRRCRELGLSGTDFDLNWALMNARKSSDLSLLPKTKRYTVTETDEFEYASELAVRHLQLTRDVSLDHIICDPELAKEFDEYAMRLAPGFEPLQYRWVALSLRKAGRLRKDVLSKLEMPALEAVSRVADLEVSSLPDTGGLYLFSSRKRAVFLSQTGDLRHRLERHMEVSDALGLPRWLWDEGPLDLSIAAMPGVTKGPRQVAELVLVKELHPILNYQRSAA